jgi:hypothetical protein
MSETTSGAMHQEHTIQVMLHINTVDLEAKMRQPMMLTWRLTYLYARGTARWKGKAMASSAEAPALLCKATRSAGQPTCAVGNDQQEHGAVGHEEEGQPQEGHKVCVVCIQGLGRNSLCG